MRKIQKHWVRIGEFVFNFEDIIALTFLPNEELHVMMLGGHGIQLEEQDQIDAFIEEFKEHARRRGDVVHLD